MKLNVLLGATDALKTKYKNMIGDMTKYFGRSQGAFIGTKATYVSREGMVDNPSKRSYVKVVTTVDEKLDYLSKESMEFIDSLFSQEKTNSSGSAIADLIVNGKSWGIFTSLELLRLKSLIESSDLESLLSVIPVRTDSDIWNASTAEEYTKRKIWESEKTEGVSRTTEKEEYILSDPNLPVSIFLELTSQYIPKTSVRTTVVEIGDYTHQTFTGAWSHRERTGALKRKNDLLIAVIKTLKMCNDCEAVKSELTATKIFEFLFKE